MNKQQLPTVPPYLCQHCEPRIICGRWTHAPGCPMNTDAVKPLNNDMALDWEVAEKHLTSMEEAYKQLMGMPGVNPCFALGMLMELRRRFDSGERTEYLHKDIMDVK